MRYWFSNCANGNHETCPESYISQVPATKGEVAVCSCSCHFGDSDSEQRREAYLRKFGSVKEAL